MMDFIKKMRTKPMGKKYSFYNFTKLIVATLALLSFCSCAERIVKDNRFYSSSPQMLITVNEEFDYFRSGTYNELIYSLNSPRHDIGKADVDAYFFIPKGNKNQAIRRGVIVSIHTMDTMSTSLGIYWGIPLFDHSKKTFCDHGLKLIGNEPYEYVIFSGQTSDWSGGNLLYKNNISLPTCIIGKRLASKVDTITKKEITYFEDAELSGFGCKEWENMKKLSSKQLKFIEGFEKRADKAVQINSVAKD
jgi:hypothetical protein